MLAIADHVILRTEPIDIHLVSDAREESLRRWLTILDSLAQLRSGWDGYDAEAPNSTARFWAREVIEQAIAREFLPNRVLASAEGGVAVIFTRDDMYADMECFNSGDIYAGFSDRKSVSEVWSVAANPSEIAQRLQLLHDRFLA